MKIKIGITIAITCILTLSTFSALAKSGSLLKKSTSELIEQNQQPPFVEEQQAERYADENMPEGEHVKDISHLVKMYPGKSALEIIKENTNPEDIKDKSSEKPFWEQEPSSEAEEELFASLEKEKEIAKKRLVLKEKIETEKDNSKNELLQKQYDELFEEWKKQNRKTMEIVFKYDELESFRD